MDKPAQPQNISPELLELRQQIDAIDDKIIALLGQRTDFVKQVGNLKQKTKPGQCPIRPGREAEMVRGIIEKCEKAGFPGSAAAAIWRIMIGTYTSMENPLPLSVYTPERDDSLAWLAREYFGPAAPITRQPHVKRVIGDVLDGKAAVGIVPVLRTSDSSYWWTNLIQQGTNVPKIFAQIPFVETTFLGKDTSSALAIARIEPEETSNDMSVLVLEADHNVSQHRLQTAFAQAKLEATWVNIATLTPSARHHLIMVKGFLTPEHDAAKSMLAALGSSILNASFLGAYAVPVALKTGEATRTERISHVAKA